MKYPRYVQVSLDAPDEWWDPKAQKWLRKKDGVIELEDGLDATNIVRYLTLNYLIDATPIVFPEEIKAPEVIPIVESTPNQLLKDTEIKVSPVNETEEAIEETVEESIEAPKVEAVVKDKEECPYCGKEYFLKGIATHKKSCKKNPDNQ